MRNKFRSTIPDCLFSRSYLILVFVFITNFHFRLNESLFYKPSFDKPDYICSLPQDNGMTLCNHIPPYYDNRKACTQNARTAHDNHTMNISDCADWLYTTCKQEGPNPFYGKTSFDNIVIAWIAIFQVSRCHITIVMDSVKYFFHGCRSLH